MKVRNKKENVRYVNYIENAIAELEEAIDCITYAAYPELNKRTIAKIREVISSLDDVSAVPIFKP
jgi:hypothetical protein